MRQKMPHQELSEKCLVFVMYFMYGRVLVRTGM